MLVAPTVILGLALLGWTGYEFHTRAARRRAALLETIRRDPADFVRARLNEEAPHQFALNRAVEAAERAATDAGTKRAARGGELPGDPPPRRWMVVVLAISALWLVAFGVQFVLDLRIAMAVTGSLGSAVPTALIVAGMLTATTLGAAMLWDRRAAVSARVLRTGTLAAVVVFCAVLSIVVALAPKRAELDYADRIDAGRQSIAMFADDRDETARALTETAVARLEQMRGESASFYQVVAVVAGVLEGGASLAVPSGYLLMAYLSAARLARRRAAEVVKARAVLAGRREAFAARMSGLLEQAGIAQDRLGPALAGSATTGAPRSSPAASDPGAPPHAPDEDPPARSSPLRDAEPGPAADPSFDQA